MSGIEEANLVCSKCGANLNDDEKQLWEGLGGNPVYYCKNCINSINDMYFQQTLNPNLFMGLLYGIGAAIVTGIIYYTISMLTNTMFDIVLVGIGFCIAYAVSKGAGDKKGKAIQFIAVVLTLLTCIAADGFCGLSKIAANDGTTLIGFITGDGLVGIVGSIIILPYSAFRVAGFMGILFWLAGAYVALVYAAQDRVREYKQQK